MRTFFCAYAPCPRTHVLFYAFAQILHGNASIFSSLRNYSTGFQEYFVLLRMRTFFFFLPPLKESSLWGRRLSEAKLTAKTISVQVVNKLDDLSLYWRIFDPLSAKDVLSKISRIRSQ